MNHYRGLICFLGLISFCGLAVVSQAALLQVDAWSLSTNARATQGLDPGELTPQHGLYLFPYYLRVNFPTVNQTAWGVDLYTTNTQTAQFTARDGIYGGLRGVTNPLSKISLYWQVYEALPNIQSTWGTPRSVTAVAGGLGFYDDAVSGHTLSYWGKVMDSRDDMVVSHWNDFTVLRQRTLVGYRTDNNSGTNYNSGNSVLGDYPSTGRYTFNSPVYLFLGLDLSEILETQEFGTVLNLDLYNLGIPLHQGGYATPNPFTPVTGQRTNFNFFLKDINSGFKISIYTIRGRLIKTITTEKEWDGRNESGQWVEGGLYIYQVEAEGERVSGTVVVIK